MAPTLGRIVHYTLSASDADGINYARKASGGSDPRRGNAATEGQVCPAMIVRVWGSPGAPSIPVNLQVILDGNDVLWATSVVEGEGPRTFAWPARV